MDGSNWGKLAGDLGTALINGATSVANNVIDEEYGNDRPTGGPAPRTPVLAGGGAPVTPSMNISTGVLVLIGIVVAFVLSLSMGGRR